MTSIFSIFGLFEQAVLITNAMAIINEERILKKCNIIRQLAQAGFCIRRNLEFDCVKKASDFRTLYNEKLRQVLFDHRKRSFDFAENSLRINYYKYGK